MTKSTFKFHLDKKQKQYFILPLVWVLLLGYFSVNDLEAFVLFLVLPPVFVYMLIVSIKNKHVVMSIFFLLVFISQAVNPALFFLNRSDYINSTTWAVDDFNFGLLEFFIIYKDMYLLIISVFVFTLLLNKIFIRPQIRSTKTANNSVSNNNASEKQPVVNKKSNNKAEMYNRYIYLLIIFIAIPLNIFMFANGIGISTVEPERLPFKLVGITFYTRNYLIPTLLMYLYFKSRRTRVSATLILLYGMFIGALSLSKGNVVLTLLPVIVFSSIDAKKLRLVISIIYAIFLYSMVSWARQFVVIANTASLEVLSNIFLNLWGNDFIGWDIIPVFFTAISDRLYGAQYTLLANQFALNNNFQETFNFLTANTDNLSQIIYYELFRLPPLFGVVVGVSIGYLNDLILLSNKNFLLLIILALITAIYLTVSEVIIQKYICMDKAYNLLGYPLAFFMVFFLYDGVIEKFYFFLIVSVIGLYIIKFLPIPRKNISNVGITAARLNIQ